MDQVRRRRYLIAAAYAVAFTCAGSECFAQSPARIPRVAILEGGFAGSAEAKAYDDAFVQSLAALGRKEGTNLVIDRRYTEGKIDRFAALAEELVQGKPDVILAPTRLATQAVLKATRTIPVVFSNFPDPVKAGVVASLARPGGNATGFTQIPFELTGKRLELLKEAVSRLALLGALHSGDVTSLDDLDELRRVANSLGIKLVVVEASRGEAYADAFAALTQARVDALFVLASIPNFNSRQLIGELALKHRLPTISNFREEAVAGALMSYGASLLVLRRKSAGYVDRILKGEKPADLPVQRPTEFEMVINLKTAKALGLTLPQSILVRADEVIR